MEAGAGRGRRKGDEGGPPDWPEVARRLGRAWPVRRLAREAVEALRGDREDRPWLLACSGGADSVALVLWVWQAFPERQGSMRVAHFQHGVRLQAARAEAAFVGGLAAALGLNFVVGRRGRGAERVTEDSLRRARLGFLRELVAGSGARVLTGHQADDLLEHFLLRLARGSGAAGLAGLRPAGGGPGFEVARPLLRLGRERLRADLLAAGGCWCEDPTNARPDYARNRLRAEALPAWRAAVPQDLDAAADRARRRLDEEAEALDAWLEAVAGPLEPVAVHLDVRALQGLPVALFRRRLVAWLDAHGHAATLKAGVADRLVEAWTANRNAWVSIGPKLRLRLRKGTVEMVAQ